jgi:hypothetical protein
MAVTDYIIDELEILNANKKLSIDEVDELIKKFEYKELAHYLEALKAGSKPETASAYLLKALADDVLEKGSFAELKLAKGIKASFIDFALREEKANPVLIELKPAFDKTLDKRGIPTSLHYVELIPEKHKDQVQKYLMSNDFVILTNLNEAFLFDRDAIIEFKPFYKLKFTELLRLFNESESLWDTIRRLEDQYIKLDLEKQFFEDLKNWFERLSTIEFEEKNGFTKSELVVLLINKIIFIKTLEDYGLIPYMFLLDEYDSKYLKWETKGIRKILDNFFTELEEWFWDFYDTELFRTKIWDYIVKTDRNLNKFKTTFESVLGTGDWDRTFGKGMVHYNYRKIDEDIFGKAYETFIALSRKDSGIYYTHRRITQYMSEQLVKALFEPLTNEIIAAIEKNDFATARIKMQEMQRITIVDTSSGSGSYLIKTFREIYKYYQLIYAKLLYAEKITGLFDIPKHITDAKDFLEWSSLNEKKKLISRIILYHIHAIDIDGRALETAKTNIWKEAIKIEKGLFHFRKLGAGIDHILPSLELNFLVADAIYDLPIDRQIELITTHFTPAICELHQIRNQYLANPNGPDVLPPAAKIKHKVRNKLQEELGELLTHPTLVCLEFFYLFFDEEGKPLPENERGFSGVISNPPWEEIYPVKKEFAEIGKYEMDRTDFEKEFEKSLKKNKEFREKWEEYEAFYHRYSTYVMNAYSYHKMKPESSTAMRSHLNYFKLLFERDMQLLRPGGYINILIPSSFQTDEGSYGLRKLALIENSLLQLYSFENRGFIEEGKTAKTKIFPDVDNRFKFSIVFIQKEAPGKTETFDSLFYLTDPQSLYDDVPLPYSIEMVRKFSPDNLSIMEFEVPADYNLCAKIRANHLLLGDLGISMRREFNLTDDNALLNNTKSKDSLPMYEGKMIHQFNSSFCPPNYYIDKEVGHKDLLNKEISRIKKKTKTELKQDEFKKIFIANKFKIDYETYRLAYRVVASSTNERTFICSIIPKDCFSVYSLYHIVNHSYEIIGNTIRQNRVSYDNLVYYMALFNSLILNYYLRNKISANLTTNFLYELPIPKVTEKVKQEIIKRAFALLYHKSDSTLYEDLRKDLGIDKKWLSGYDNADTHNVLRAELEVLIARDLYGLNTNDWDYLTSTFIYGDESVSKKELDEIILNSKVIF